MLADFPRQFSFFPENCCLREQESQIIITPIKKSLDKQIQGHRLSRSCIDELQITENYSERIYRLRNAQELQSKPDRPFASLLHKGNCFQNIEVH